MSISFLFCKRDSNSTEVAKFIKYQPFWRLFLAQAGHSCNGFLAFAFKNKQQEVVLTSLSFLQWNNKTDQFINPQNIAITFWKVFEVFMNMYKF